MNKFHQPERSFFTLERIIKNIKKTLEKLEVLLFKKEQILKIIKETSLNENINCDSKINKIFESISNKNHNLKNNLYSCKEDLSKKITEKKTLSKNKSNDIEDFNKLVDEYKILFKEKKAIENKLNKKTPCKKEKNFRRREYIADRSIKYFVGLSAKKIMEYSINKVAIIDSSNTYERSRSTTKDKYNYIRKKLIDEFFNKNKRTLDIIYPWEARDRVEKIKKQNTNYDDFYLSIGTVLKVDAILIITNRYDEYVKLELLYINGKETLVSESIPF
jgi:hypothetical protein